MNTSIIGDTRVDSCLEIVYMLRRYEFFSKMEASTTIAPDELKQDELTSILKLLTLKDTLEDTVEKDTVVEEDTLELEDTLEFEDTLELEDTFEEKDNLEDEDTLELEDPLEEEDKLEEQDTLELEDPLEEEDTLELEEEDPLEEEDALKLEDKLEDNLWFNLRRMNSDWRGMFLSRINQKFTSTKELTIAPSSPQDEDAKRTLINMLNMLSWYKFDSTVKASTSTSAPTIAASTSHEKDNIWRLRTKVLNLFNQALKDAFPEFTKKCMMLWLPRDDHFQCDNVIDIWPEIKKSKSNRYPDIKGPKEVGKRIKDKLVKQKSDMKLKSHMIEGDPYVYGVGFVAIKLSGNWMAENIHKMLRDGIDTWAPKHELDFKSTIINSPSWDESNLTPMDALRRQSIIMSLMHMLEYKKSAAMTSSGNGMSLPSDELDKHFRTVTKDGEMLIYAKDEGNSEPILRGKCRGKSLRESDGCLGYPLEDLAALWHGLVSEKTDWIVCVAPSQQQEYVENCLNAAEHAGWTSDEIFWPLATYVGFKTCSTSLEDLLSFLYKAQYPREAGEAAKVLGYTDEAVLDCALTYTFLKYHRMADCKFSYKEMLDIKGDTFVHLLTTQAQIRNITNDSRKDIDELQKASELVLEEDKVIWSEGVERELGLHLLMFTELINESYASFLPHLICGYLNNLSKRFSCFYETYASSGFEDKTRLLLCEATAVVMEKGFHLLGITQKPSLQAVSAALTLNYVAPLEVVLKPLANTNVRTRFEVFTTYVHITRDLEFEDGELFGCIQVSDIYGLLPDGWGVLLDHGPGNVCLLEHDCRHTEKMQNNGRLKICNPSSRHSVPFSESMRICVLLYATTKEEDDFFQVCKLDTHMDFSSFLESDSQISREYLVGEGDDGHMRMHYILLRDAVDATIGVKLDGICGRTVGGEILAYYEKSDNGDDLVESLYKASLLESCDDGSGFKDGDVILTRSRLAVPIKGSLVIEALLTDLASGDYILRGSCVFDSHCNGIFNKTIKNEDCTLEVQVQVTWSQD